MSEHEIDLPVPVTVVIPTNRGGPYLDEAVASVRAQSVPVREIILVDDGSPSPGLRAVATALDLTYVGQPASGLSVARNTGASHVGTTWVAFLDDDDVWHPERIERQLAMASAHPHAVAVASGGWYMDGAGDSSGAGWDAPPAPCDSLLSGAVETPRITTLLIRSDHYAAVGGCRSAMEPSEDNDLILRLLQRGEIAAVDERLVGYRRHDANVTRRGLRGRVAASRSIRSLRDAARRRGDQRTAVLLTANLRGFRRRAGRDNLGEMITAWRAAERGYAVKLASWALRHPLSTMAAITDRARHAGGSRRAR